MISIWQMVRWACMTSSVANCLNIYTFITFLLVVWFYSNFFCSAHKFFSSCWKSYYFVVDSPLKIMKTVWNSSSSLKLRELTSRICKEKKGRIVTICSENEANFLTKLECFSNGRDHTHNWQRYLFTFPW